jgi:DNA (cytosine-5)-methyltransferase 1
MNHVNHLSLCAGVGGIDLGLRSVIEGFRTVALVEREAFCIANLASQIEAGGLDTCPIFTDLVRFPWGRFTGVVDVVSGGFPCQPFSHAGKRDGVEDERHLWPHIKEGVSILGNGICFFENVDGIASAKSPGYHSVLHHVLCDLEEMGFTTTAGCFTAEEVGAPHLRKRWFILGVKDPHSGRYPCIRDMADTNNTRGHTQEYGTMPPDWSEGSGVGEGVTLTKPTGLGDIEVAHPRCDLEATRGECETTSSGGDRSGDVETGSGRDVGSGHCSCAGETPSMADTDNTRLGEQRGAGTTKEEHSSFERRGFPSPPGRFQYEWEPSRTTEPGIRGGSNGVSTRVDRLRAMGNAVVPQTAAKAFSTLWHRIQNA